MHSEHSNSKFSNYWSIIICGGAIVLNSILGYIVYHLLKKYFERHTIKLSPLRGLPAYEEVCAQDAPPSYQKACAEVGQFTNASRYVSTEVRQCYGNSVDNNVYRSTAHTDVLSNCSFSMEHTSIICNAALTSPSARPSAPPPLYDPSDAIPPPYEPEGYEDSLYNVTNAVGKITPWYNHDSQAIFFVDPQQYQLGILAHSENFDPSGRNGMGRRPVTYITDLAMASDFNRDLKIFITRLEWRYDCRLYTQMFRYQDPVEDNEEHVAFREMVNTQLRNFPMCTGPVIPTPAEEISASERIAAILVSALHIHVS